MGRGTVAFTGIIGLSSIPSESHETHEPRSLQIEKGNSTFNCNAEIYAILHATCLFLIRAILYGTSKLTPVMKELSPPKSNLRACSPDVLSTGVLRDLYLGDLFCGICFGGFVFGDFF